MKRTGGALGYVTLCLLFLIAPAVVGQQLTYVPSPPAWGTFFSLQLTNLPPLPFNPMPELDVYSFGDIFLFDDSLIEYGPGAFSSGAPEIPGEGEAGEGATNNIPPAYQWTTNDLWLEVPTNCFAVAGEFTVLLHNGVASSNYQFFTRTNLSEPVWKPELVLTNAVGTLDSVQMVMNERSNLFVRACESGLVVSTNHTALELAQIIMGTNVIITNAIYTGADVARGTFTNGICAGLPIDTGIILSTGHITNAIGPNNDDGWIAAGGLNQNSGPSVLNESADPDLNSLVGGSGSQDAAILEFDVISTNSITMLFEFVYASEEYPEWIAQFNDPFAIFVTTNRTGTNWVLSSSNNIALTMNQPVNASSINGGSVDPDISATNSEFYLDNADPINQAKPEFAAIAPVSNIQFDGMTVLLNAQVLIGSNVTNHFKIAIADVTDRRFDSAVFLRGRRIP